MTDKDTTSSSGDEFNIEASVPNFRDYLRRYSEASARTRERLSCQLDIAYGDMPPERLDLFPTEKAGAPTLVFLHGGGWRASSKSDRSFPAEVFVPAGAHYVSMEYPLAPEHSLDQIVTSVRRGLSWLWLNAGQFGLDQQRIFVCGNSAGGHLAGMLLADGWREAHGLPDDAIAGACTLSGVFEMEPLMHSGAQEWLKLDSESVLRNSPIRHIPQHGCPFIGVVGQLEPGAFVRQTMEYCTAWAAAGHTVDVSVASGHNHFSIIGELGNEASPVFSAICRMMELS